MGFRHNNILANEHFHKDWQRYVTTWFDQPGQKKRRRTERLKKAARVAPRPTSLLRPVVRCPTVKYNMKNRAGRGFTYDELKAAGFKRKEALSLGIPVDHRRKNRSEEGFKRNVDRLQDYKKRLIVFPRSSRSHGKKSKKMEVDQPNLETVDTINLHTVHPTARAAGRGLLPIPVGTPVEAPRAITAEEKDQPSQFRRLRDARAEARHKGKREARAKAKEEDEAAKKK